MFFNEFFSCRGGDVGKWNAHFYMFFDNFLYNMKEATVDQKIMKNEIYVRKIENLNEMKEIL